VLPNKPPPVAGAVVAGVEPNENGAGEGVWAGVGPVTESCGTPACACGWAGAVDVEPKLNLGSAQYHTNHAAYPPNAILSTCCSLMYKV
jgi:hypothetical protein